MTNPNRVAVVPVGSFGAGALVDFGLKRRFRGNEACFWSSQLASCGQGVAALRYAMSKNRRRVSASVYITTRVPRCARIVEQAEIEN